jgi:hypothetical protein
MTVVNLTSIRANESRSAINWLIKTYGPQGTRWRLQELSSVEFAKERDATLFLLHWG